MSIAKHEVALPPDSELIFSDGVPLESPWHVNQIALLTETVQRRFSGRRDYFCGGNMFVYFSPLQVRNRDFLGPDFLLVRGVDLDKPRNGWVAWHEGGRLPGLVIELLSPSTAEEDRTTKKDLYERTLRIPEYFLFDPEFGMLDGWRLTGDRYVAIPDDERNAMWSEQLEARLAPWSGRYREQNAVWLRLFDQEGRLIPTGDEIAEAERNRAEAERAKLASAEAEIARLKAMLEGREPGPSTR